MTSLCQPNQAAIAQVQQSCSVNIHTVYTNVCSYVCMPSFSQFCLDSSHVVEVLKFSASACLYLPHQIPLQLCLLPPRYTLVLLIPFTFSSISSAWSSTSSICFRPIELSLQEEEVAAGRDNLNQDCTSGTL